MKPADFVDEDTKSRFQMYAREMKKAYPIVVQMRDEGMPIQEHVNKFADHLQWIAKIQQTFQIMD